MTCIKTGSDESHFNVSVGSDGQSHRTVPINHSLFEEKGEPKRYRTEVLLLTTTERALFISAQLSTDAVSALRKFRVLIIKAVDATGRRCGLAVRR